MTQWGFYYDQTRCLGCKGCTVACKEWNEDKRGDRFPDREMTQERAATYDTPSTWETPDRIALLRQGEMQETWRRVTTYEFGSVPPNVDVVHLSLGCNHCEKPACVATCPVKAIEKEPEFGAVLVNSQKCIACGSCREACPWGAPQFYDSIYKYRLSNPQLPRMTKCTMCIDRIRVGLKPSCVAACVNRALDFGPMEELRKKYPNAQKTATGFTAEAAAKTGPNILFNPRKARA